MSWKSWNFTSASARCWAALSAVRCRALLSWGSTPASWLMATAKIAA